MSRSNERRIETSLLITTTVGSVYGFAQDAAQAWIVTPHRGMSRVAGHLPTGFRAAAALVRTFICDLVARELLAALRAYTAHLGAYLTHATMRR
jgi:hypothetical protein